MDGMASQITVVSNVYSTVCSEADQREHQSPASLAFVPGIHRSPVNSPHKGPVIQKMFIFDGVIIKKSEVVYYFSGQISKWSILHNYLAICGNMWTEKVIFVRFVWIDLSHKIYQL